MFWGPETGAAGEAGDGPGGAREKAIKRIPADPAGNNIDLLPARES